MEIDHEISTVILSLLLIQDGQLSVSGKRLCTILVNHLEDKLAFAVAATARKCRLGLLIAVQLFICLPGVC